MPILRAALVDGIIFLPGGSGFAAALLRAYTLRGHDIASSNATQSTPPPRATIRADDGVHATLMLFQIFNCSRPGRTSEVRLLTYHESLLWAVGGSLFLQVMVIDTPFL
jgi:hypothetical protein